MFFGVGQQRPRLKGLVLDSSLNLSIRQPPAYAGQYSSADLVMSVSLKPQSIRGD